MLQWTKSPLTSILLLLLLLYTANCQSARDKKSEHEFHCCSPSQWTARVRHDSASVIDGVNTYQETWMTLHYDSINQRVAYTDVSGSEALPSVRTIEDYKNHSWTIIMEKGLNVCVTYNLTGHFVHRCTPRNASLVLFALAGALCPIEGVFANTVYYNRPGVTGQVTVTVGDCAFVEEETYDYSVKGHALVDTIQYFNYTLSVDDSVFKIPDNCVYVPPDYVADSARQRINQLPRSHN